MALIPAEVLAGARNCVIEWAGVKEGQNVLILAEISPNVEEIAIEALAAVAEQAGANVQVMWVRQLLKSWWEDVPPVVIAAYRAADVVIHSHYSIGRAHKPIHKAIEDGTIRVRNYGTTARILGSPWARFPIGLYNEIDGRMIAKLRAAKTFRATTEAGTDVSGELIGSLRHFDGVKIRSKGRNRPFPPGPHIPMKTANGAGVIFTNNTYPWGARLWGLPETFFKEPVKITVEAGRVTKIEGGREAELMQKAFDFIATKAKVGDEIYRLDSFHTGMHHMAFTPVPPEIDPDLWWHLMHHHPGWFHFHLGGDPDRDYGTQYMTHITASCFNATVWLDGEKIYDRGRLLLLDDPELIEIAKQYGDPDELFAYKPLQFTQ
jgi:hypothetical protein